MASREPLPSARRQGTWRDTLWSWGPVALYCAVIFGLSSIPNIRSLPAGMSDKVAHALLYAPLGFLVARWLAPEAARGRRGRIALLSVLACLAYGLSDETHQLFVPGREFDLKDLAADGVGAAAGTVGWWLWGIIGPVSAISARSRGDSAGG